LALSITFSLIASLFVALTIVPVLSYGLFKSYYTNGVNQKGKKMSQPQFQGGRDLYRKWLTKALEHRRLVLGATIGLFVASLAIIPFLGMEFMPSQDQDMILLKVKMPVGTALEETNRVVTTVEKIMSEQPEISMINAQAGSSAEENASDSGSSFSPSGPHEGLLWVGLVHQSQRKMSDVQVLERIRSRLPKLENVSFEALDMSQSLMGTRAPVEIKIFGKDLGVLKGLADGVVARIQNVPGLRDVSHTLSQGKPEYQIRIDRDRAARLGLMVSQVAGTVQTATLGTVATRYREGNEEIDLRVRFKKQYRDNINEIENIPIVTPTNKVVYVGQLATINKGEGPIQIAHENQSRLVTVLGNIAGRDLGSVIKDVRARLGAVQRQLPPGYFLEFGGSYQQMTEAFKILAAVFALASLMVYMVMASGFESFRHPFIVMFTIPMGIIGVVFGLLIAGRPINLPVWIGVILLAGIAVNNGIVMIDYMNQLRQRGVDGHKAIIEGAVTRLRAVLLTALTTVLGMLPMAISRSEGSAFRSPMAITVMGGLTATTFLTLFVIPIIYSLFERVSFRKVKAG
jgi:HAE1 family hydrophobic/amphiphilic exporter-1